MERETQGHWQQKAEVHYQRIESHIEIIKDFWMTANALGIPRKSDTMTRKLQDQESLRGVIDRALSRTGKRTQFEEFEKISLSLDELDKKDGELRGEMSEDDFVDSGNYDIDLSIQRLGLNSQLGVMLEDPDIALLDEMDRAVQRIGVRREHIRDLQKKVGGRVSTSEQRSKSNDLSRFEVLLEGETKKFSGQIMKVVYRPFSINLFIHPAAFKEVFGRYNGISSGAVNFISNFYTPEEYTTALLFGQGDRLSNNQNTTLKHEDFHSFADAFDLGPSIRAVSRKYEERLKRYKRLRELQAPEVILENELKLLGKSVKDISDASREELLAEIASKNERVGIPSSTFWVHNSKKTDLLSQMLSEEDPRISAEILKYKKLLDIKEFRDQIEWIYREANEEIPDRWIDLDMAFALFPPTKIRHIERLLKRWIKKDPISQ